MSRLPGYSVPLLALAFATPILSGCLSSSSTGGDPKAAIQSPRVSTVIRYYVDPRGGVDTNAGTQPGKAFRTLERARDAVRALPRPLKSPVEVVLADGDYQLQQPFSLSAADAGEAGRTVRYIAAPGAAPTLQGGLRVTGWTLHDKTQGIYQASLPKGTETRQLFVNGRRALRARSVAGLGGIERTAAGYTLPAKAPLGAWKNPQDIEFVYRQIWTNPRAGVASVHETEGKVVVTMDQPGFDNARNKGMTSIDKPWYVENAYELLDEPGEWYLDRTGAVGDGPYTLYYKPTDWQDLARDEVVVPVLEQLVTVEAASTAAPASFIEFEGITFAYTTWLRPSSEFSLPDAQNNVMRENFVQRKTSAGDFESIIDGAALRLRHAKDITIRRCRFLHLGGMGVSFATAGAQGNHIEGNTFSDISATGLQIGDYVSWSVPGSPNEANTADPRLVASGNRIENNFFNRCGVEYRSSCAIGLAFPRDTVIAHNEIYNVPYSGLHLGWGWDRVPRTVMGGNRIESNRIQNTMLEMADGACIYTLGPSDPDHAPTVVRGNYVRQTRWGHGLYFDESSSYYDVRENLVLASSDANVKINGKLNSDTKVTGLYADKSRDIVSEGLDMKALRLSIEPVKPHDAPEHVATVKRLQSEAGLQPTFLSARQFPRDAVMHEWEEGDLSGGTFATNGMDERPTVSGYSGMGYVSGLQGRAGATAGLAVEVAKAGPHELRLRYATGEKPVQGLSLVINGEARPLPALAPTGGGSRWTTLVLPISLPAGSNSFTLTTTRKDSAPLWLDRLDVVPAQ